MNSSLPEMLHCLKTTGNIVGVKGMEMSVLERQKMVLKWQQQQLLPVHQHSFQQQQQQELSCFNDLSMLSFLPTQEQDFRGLDMNFGTSPTLNEIMNQPIKADPGVENNWMDFGMQNSGVTVESLGIESVRQVSGPDCGVNYAISRTASCPPTVAMEAEAAINTTHDAKAMESLIAEQKPSVAVGRESCKKRKAEKSLILPKVLEAQEDNRSKKSKGCIEEEESRVTEETSNRSSKSSQSKQKASNSNKKTKETSGCRCIEEEESRVTEETSNRSSKSSQSKQKASNSNKKTKETSGCTSKDNSKVSELQKPDYIHVRARRGQATDSHSLAERVRREKISERMRYLQDLVPGCNKITGKAGMLDEIINYVQSLQRQVEFLSMKLATVNPRLDFNIEDLIAKEVFAACSGSSPTLGLSPDLTTPNCLQYNIVQQMDPVCGSEFMTNSADMGLRRSITAPVSDNLVDSTCFNLIPSSLQWNADLQNIYNMEFQQGRPASYPIQTLTGTSEASSLKMEM